MTQTNKRRDFVKLLAVAGLSLYFPSCKSDDRKNPSNLKDDKSKDPVSEMEEAIKSNNVTYLKKADEQFDELNQSFNLAVSKTPALIALCVNTEGISEAIKFARKEGLKVAVKSGGHSFENFSSIDDGIQINLSLMDEVKWIDQTIVRIQPSCTLREMYDALLPKGRIIPAGSCGGVGIGGLTLGGGYGFFARKYGLTCDSLMEATFVDGMGEIHTVRQEDELMWALKGGGNGNFGIVSSFTFKTQVAPKTFTRHRFKAYKLDKTRAKDLLQAYFKYSKKLPESCFAAFVLNYKTLVLLITNYGTNNEALENMIDAFSELCDDVSIGAPKNLAESLRTYYGIEYPIYFKNASAGYYENYETIATSIDQVLDIVFKKRGLIYQINTLGGNINNPVFENDSCYPHRSSPYLSELQYYWDEKKDPTELLKSFDEIQNLLYENGIRKQYRNYPSLGFKEWEKAYFGEHYKRLQSVKKTYDPENLFDYKQSIKSS